MLDNYNFYKSVALKNLNEYFPMRVSIDLSLVYYLIKFFQPRSILEIGVNQGLTFGLMFEAAPVDCSLTGIDLPTQVYFANLFRKHYNADTERIKFIEISSDDFVSDHCYDFINVDGDHNMPRQYTDIVKSADMLNDHGILMIDDVDMPGVDKAINKFLSEQSEIVPFLLSTQTLFLHKPQYHRAGEFLDALSAKFADFCTFEVYNYKSHSVPKISCISAIIKHTDIFKMICEKYSI